MYDQTPVLVHVAGDALPAVVGHGALQIDAGGFVGVAAGGKPMRGVVRHRGAEAHLGQVRRQPRGVGVGVNRHALQGQAGAVGQVLRGKIALRLR